jgi:competence protein ComEC
VNPPPHNGSHLHSRQPALWAALAFAAGIAAGAYLWRPPLWWLLAATLFAAFGAYFSRRRAWAASALGLCALFAVGALTFEARIPAHSPASRLLEFADGRQVFVTGHVASAGEFLPDGADEARQALDIETEQVSTEGQSTAVRSVLRLRVYSKRARRQSEAATKGTVPAHIFHYGERLRFPVKLYAPRNFRNPGAFDYRSYLANQGITALGSTKGEEVEVLPGFAGSLG